MSHSTVSKALMLGLATANIEIGQEWTQFTDIAQRMEAKGEAGKLNISAVTHDLIKETFECEYRGKIDADGKGQLDMHFINRPRLAIAKRIGSV